MMNRSSSVVAPIELEDLSKSSSSSSSSSTEMKMNNNDDLISKILSHQQQKESNPIEAWLPVTKSRNGNIFHLVSSGIGSQALLLPFAFATLGRIRRPPKNFSNYLDLITSLLPHSYRAWGITILTLGFAWKLYSTWLLVHLHETSSGVRYSRYMQVAMAAFGPKLAKWLCMFPVLYLSGGTCTMLVITGGSTMKLLYKVMCYDDIGSHCWKNLSSNEWFLIFISMAFIVSLQHSNLSSLVWVSLIGAIASTLFVSLIWITSLAQARVIKDVSYDPLFQEFAHKFTQLLGAFSAMEFIALSFRGHNLILEIQGTLPSNSKTPSHVTMWKAVKISYFLEALCFFPLAIVGYWAYGNKLTRAGILSALEEFHKDCGSMTMLALILVLIIVHQLCSYQPYAMLSFDNLEFQYVMAKNRPCPFWVRILFKAAYCFAVNLFLAITFPFLPSLGSIMGAIGMLVTFAYPCFMYVCIKQPNVRNPMFLLNWGLGCLGVVLCVISFIVAIWDISRLGLKANFFHAY